MSRGTYDNPTTSRGIGGYREPSKTALYGANFRGSRRPVSTDGSLMVLVPEGDGYLSRLEWARPEFCTEEGIPSQSDGTPSTRPRFEDESLWDGDPSGKDKAA